MASVITPLRRGTRTGPGEACRTGPGEACRTVGTGPGATRRWGAAPTLRSAMEDDAFQKIVGATSSALPRLSKPFGSVL